MGGGGGGGGGQKTEWGGGGDVQRAYIRETMHSTLNL